MKKYLNKNLHIIKTTLFLSFYGVTLLFSSVFAQTKLEYYKNIFNTEFGFTLYEEVFGSGKSNTLLDYFSTTDSKNSYVVTLSSDLYGESDLKSLTERHKNVILICNESYSTETPVSFSCDKSEVNSAQLEKINGFLKTASQENIDLYVIPENLLVSIEGRSEINNYFTAFRRSNDVTSSFKGVVDTGEKGLLREEVKSLLDTTLFKIFSLAVAMFALASLSFGLLKFFSSENRDSLRRGFIKNTLKKVSDYFSCHRWVVFYGLLILLVMYIPIVITLGIKDGQGVNIGYFITYSIDTFKISNLVSYISQENYIRVVILFYNFIFLVTVAILIIPYLVNTILIGSLKIEKTELKYGFYKYPIPVLIVISLYILVSSDILSSYKLLILILLVLLFLVFKNIKFNTFNFQYSSRDKLVFIPISFLVLIVGVYLRLSDVNRSLVYQREDLIGVSDDIVLLPYAKKMKDRVLFKEHLTKLSEPLFVNQYLVYSPNHSIVENKNISDFKNEGTFIIQNGDLKDVISTIYSNDEVRRFLTSQSPTNFFMIKGYGSNLKDEDTKIQITFTCNVVTISKSKLKANLYYFYKNEDIKESNVDVLHFPGCLKEGIAETYTVDFNVPYIETGEFFVELLNISNSDVGDVQLVKSGNIITPVYYSTGSGYSVLALKEAEVSSKTSVTNYIFEDSYDLSFDMNLDSEGKFDISQPINELVKEGVLKDNFLIWSTKKYLPIRLD